MGLLKKAAFVVVVGVAISYYLSSRKASLPQNFGGYVEPGFELVEHAFRKNFEDGFEPDGAAFAVCHRGKMVVDIWGGYADKAAARPWMEDTMAMAWSTTKGVAAIVVAVLVDRGYLNYNDLVTKYWPEFGANGKDNVSVKMLVGHEAGLAVLDRPITKEAVRDWRQMSKLFEQQVPNWPPGTDAGYHGMTFGSLCDQLVRRTDPQHRSLGKFFQDEIAKPFGIDFYIGLPRDQTYRVARITPSTTWDILKRLDDWQFVQFMANFMFAKRSPSVTKMFDNVQWMYFDNPNVLVGNNPEIQEMEIASINGIGTARALAKLFCLFDDSKLLSTNLVKTISQPGRWTPQDKVVGMNMTWGWGFIHSTNPQGNNMFGHLGLGGQNAKFDPQERLGFAYLRNNMAPDIGDLTRTFSNLQRAMFESIRAMKK